MFKPMLADNKIPTMEQLRFPLMVSPKLDGVRATVQDGKLYSRSLKLIPNQQVQEKFKGLPDGLDGELIVGEPNEDPYRRTVSVVMSEDKSAEDVRYYLFDKFEDKTFEIRMMDVLQAVASMHKPRYSPVYALPHYKVETPEELLKYESLFLEKGFEGAMVNSINGLYKQGRSTIKEGALLKLKRFVDAEAKIIAYAEEMENTNEATINELGKTERSSHQAGLVGKDTLGALIVVGVNGEYKDVEFRIGGGFTAQMKRDIWAKREELLHTIVNFKYFPTGSKDKPRMPIYKGPRDKRDM